MTKINKLTRYLFPGFFMLAVFASGALLISPNVPAQEALSPEMLDQISREVMRQMLEDGALDEQIELGIQRYIVKQRQAQANKQTNAQANARAKAKKVRPVASARDHIYGDLNAPISLIEYSDIECPYCKRFHPTAKKIVDNSGGKVNWVYRHFPLGFHNPLAQQEAEATECAALLGGNEAFWRYTDLLYERTRSNGNGLKAELLTPFAGEIGLDEVKFIECLESGRMTARVQEDVDEGARIGISGTPGNIILNNETREVIVAAGALPYEDLRRMTNSLLTDAQ
jgi:protein-disulfide isomerase